jgi:hypothetical protein
MLTTTWQYVIVHTVLCKVYQLTYTVLVYARLPWLWNLRLGGSGLDLDSEFANPLPRLADGARKRTPTRRAPRLALGTMGRLGYRQLEGASTRLRPTTRGSNLGLDVNPTSPAARCRQLWTATSAPTDCAGMASLANATSTPSDSPFKFPTRAASRAQLMGPRPTTSRPPYRH